MAPSSMGTVQVVRRKSKAPAGKSLRVYDQFDTFGRFKQKGCTANILLRVENVADKGFTGIVLADHGSITVADRVAVDFRESKLPTGVIQTDPFKDLLQEGLAEGAVVCISQAVHETQGYISALNGEVVRRADEEAVVLPDVLASVRPQKTANGNEIVIARRSEPVPVYGVTKGLDDMVAVLNGRHALGDESGFLLRGTDKKTGKFYARYCVPTAEQRRKGKTSDDLLTEFLRTQVPGRLSKMVRDNAQSSPWQIVPVDVLQPTHSNATRAAIMHKQIGFSKSDEGDDLLFAEAAVALKKADDGTWQVSYIKPHRPSPTLVGADYPDGRVEPDLEMRTKRDDDNSVM